VSGGNGCGLWRQFFFPGRWLGVEKEVYRLFSLGCGSLSSLSQKVIVEARVPCTRAAERCAKTNRSGAPQFYLPGHTTNVFIVGQDEPLWCNAIFFTKN
jgi:hypothetical protein